VLIITGSTSMGISGKNAMFNDTAPSNTELTTTQRVIVRAWKLLVVNLCVLFLVSWLSMEHAQRYRGPGFDFKLSRASTENLFTYHRSQHDVNRLLDPPELRPTDGGWHIALSRFYAENLTWIKRVVELHPSQAHPVFLSAYFAPTLLTTTEAGAYWYNITQIFLFTLSLILIGKTPRSSLMDRPRYIQVGSPIFFLLMLLLLLHPLIGHAFSANVMWGQTNIPVLAMTALGIFAISREWFGIAGAFIGIAAGDKIFPFLLILTVPCRYWLKFIFGAAITIGSLLLLLVTRCGLVAFIDFLRWPAVAWHSNYNLISDRGAFWEYPPVNHSISHGISAISTTFSVGSYFELLILSILGVVTFALSLNTVIVRHRSKDSRSIRTLNLLPLLAELRWILLLLLLGLAFREQRREALYLILLYLVVQTLRKLITIKNTSHRVLCISGVILLVVFPAIFNLIYDHHLVFLIAGGWSLTVAIGKTVQNLSVRLITCILLVSSICLCNLPYHTLPFDSDVAHFQPSCPILGIFLAVIVLYLWSRTKDFREFACLS
jgi:hypothetical protein